MEFKIVARGAAQPKEWQTMATERKKKMAAAMAQAGIRGFA